MRLTIALVATLIFVFWQTLAFGQYPPPGIYRCNSSNGTPAGTLTLLADGDYQFAVADGPGFRTKAGDAGNGKGQLASAGSSITAQSGPLADIYHWKGSFSTDKQRHTVFSFTGAMGAATCKVGI